MHLAGFRPIGGAVQDRLSKTMTEAVEGNLSRLAWRSDIDPLFEFNGRL